MRFNRIAVAALSAVFFGSASAQNVGDVTNHAFLIGQGAGNSGYTSLLCGSAQLAVGQAAADPICQTITGDVTITAGGVTAIGATKVTSAMLNSDVFSTAHTWGGQQTFVAPILGTPASATLTNATGLPIGSGVANLGSGVAVFLNVPSSANLLSALTTKTGTGNAVFGTSPTLVTPILGAATATSLNGLSIFTGNAQANIGLGTSLSSQSGSTSNVFLSNANALTAGDQNVVIGTGGTGNSLTVDSGNTLIGYDVAPSLHNAIIPNNFNTMIGNQAGRQCTGCGSNVFLGRAAGLAATIDDHNTAVGHATLFAGSGNSQVTAIGDSAGGAALAGTAIPAGFPNVGVNVFAFNADTNIECIGETCGKTSSTARKQSFAIGSYSRIPAQDNSAWLGNGLTVAGTFGKWWTGTFQSQIVTSGSQALTASNVLSGFIDRSGSPGAGFTDTLPTAQQIIQSTAGGPGNGCETPISRQFFYSNRSGQTATIATNTGLTLASVTGVLTVATGIGTVWNMQINNCGLGSEAITIFRVQ